MCLRNYPHSAWRGINLRTLTKDLYRSDLDLREMSYDSIIRALPEITRTCAWRGFKFKRTYEYEWRRQYQSTENIIKLQSLKLYSSGTSTAVQITCITKPIEFPQSHISNQEWLSSFSSEKRVHISRSRNVLRRTWPFSYGPVSLLLVIIQDIYKHTQKTGQEQGYHLV